jgi:hypothetical protein
MAMQGVRSYSSFAPTDHDSVFGHDLARLATAIPRLASQQQQTRVMLAEIVIPMHGQPPRPCAGRK